MTNDQCFFAECFEGVVCSSKLTWTCLTELKNRKLERSCFPGAENLLKITLLRAHWFFSA